MNNELYHYGISGMKWGKRNGPPYPLTDKAKSLAERTRNRTYKKTKEMSDEELAKENKRLEAERKYRQLKKEDKEASMNFVEKLLKKEGDMIINKTTEKVAEGLAFAASAAILAVVLKSRKV